MPASSFTLANGVATSGSTTYTLQSTDLKGAGYINTDSSLAQPDLLVIIHDNKPAGSLGNDRHTVSVKKTRIDPVTGKVHTASATLTMSVPRAGGLSDDKIIDVVVNLTNFFTEARIKALIDGIVPNS